MDVTQLIDGYDRSFHPGEVMGEPHSESSSLATVTGFLDAALRMWDEDHTKAKSQIKVARAMLSDCTRELIGQPQASGG